ncbi:hypothetical protein JOM56_013158 [Amanita muscaria]
MYMKALSAWMTAEEVDHGLLISITYHFGKIFLKSPTPLVWMLFPGLQTNYPTPRKGLEHKGDDLIVQCSSATIMNLDMKGNITMEYHHFAKQERQYSCHNTFISPDLPGKVALLEVDNCDLSQSSKRAKMR